MSEIQIPFEARQIIDELVEFRETGKEPLILRSHLDSLASVAENTYIAFFRQQYEEMRRGIFSYSLSRLEHYLRFEVERIVLAKAEGDPDKPDDRTPQAILDYESFVFLMFTEVTVVILVVMRTTAGIVNDESRQR